MSNLIEQRMAHVLKLERECNEHPMAKEFKYEPYGNRYICIYPERVNGADGFRVAIGEGGKAKALLVCIDKLEQAWSNTVAVRMLRKES